MKRDENKITNIESIYPWVFGLSITGVGLIIGGSFLFYDAEKQPPNINNWGIGVYKWLGIGFIISGSIAVALAVVLYAVYATKVKNEMLRVQAQTMFGGPMYEVQRMQ
jgi:hypothetical protein